MKQIIDSKDLAILSDSLKKKKVVLVGGCFDILHLGHIDLLENAKEHGDILVVFLESDERVKRLKGDGRPVNSQIDRARVLLALKAVDYVVLLPFIETGDEYDTLVTLLSPKVIATTKGDKGISFKERAAQRVGARVEEVTEFLPQKSSTKIIEVLSKEL